MRLALDAGHGMYTPGKRVPKELDPKETREWVLNDRVVKHLIRYLENFNVDILRVDDPIGTHDVPLRDRVRKANDFKADLYLSIHHNAFEGVWSGGGTSVYRYPSSTKTPIDLLQSFYNEVVNQTKLYGNRISPINEANFHVLRETKMTAILLENGFMDSKVDWPIIKTDEHAKKTATGIVNFLILNYGIRHIAFESSTYYRVITGSFKYRENAEARVEELKKAGFDSFISVYKKDQ